MTKSETINEYCEKVTRLEVIDHSNITGFGRTYSVWHDDIRIETSLQDGARTLKIFIVKRNPTIS